MAGRKLEIGMEEGFKKLIVWQKAYSLALETYKLTNGFPKHELYGLVSQIRRAIISVSGNIAEGYERQHRREYIQFLMIAKGSLGEFETYILFALDLGYVNTEQYNFIESRRKEIGRLLMGLSRSLRLDP